MITLDSIDYQHSSVQIKDAAGDALAIGADGSLNVTDNGGSLTVDDGGGSLTIDGTVSISGNVTVDQGTSPWVVGDGGGSLTVDGTVELGASTLAALENITVDAMPGTFAEDTAHASGDIGMQVLAVRRDTPSSFVSADGDYSPLMLNSSGSLRVVNPFNNTIGSAIGTNVALVGGTDGGTARAIKVDATGQVYVVASDLDIRDLSHSQDSVKIGDGTDFLAVNADGSINAQFTEAGYASWKVSTATVGLTEAQLVASPLANRLRIEIQNLGTKDVWIKEATGVSISNGLKIPKGSSYEQALDAGAAIYAISDGASADLRIAEYAA